VSFFIFDNGNIAWRYLIGQEWKTANGSSPQRLTITSYTPQKPIFPPSVNPENQHPPFIVDFRHITSEFLPP